MSESLNQILNDYQLAEKDCNVPVSDLHLKEISQSYYWNRTNWKSLPAHLKMIEIEVDDSEQEKRHAFLREWKAVKGSDATYKNLINALLAIECRQDAEGVCKLLQKPQSAPVDHVTSGMW